MPIKQNWFNQWINYHWNLQMKIGRRFHWIVLHYLVEMSISLCRPLLKNFILWIMLKFIFVCPSNFKQILLNVFLSIKVTISFTCSNWTLWIDFIKSLSNIDEWASSTAISFNNMSMTFADKCTRTIYDVYLEVKNFKSFSCIFRVLDKHRPPVDSFFTQNLSWNFLS